MRHQDAPTKYMKVDEKRLEQRIKKDWVGSQMCGRRMTDNGDDRSECNEWQAWVKAWSMVILNLGVRQRNVAAGQGGGGDVWQYIERGMESNHMIKLDINKC